MKAPSARVAMLLSIGGVLAAGSAAALVNSQVLDEQSDGAPASATAVSTTVLPVVTTTQPATTVTAVPATAATVPATTATAIATQLSTAPSVATASTAATTIPAATAAGGATQATYRLGDAGTALLDTAGGRLTIVSVTPVSGWSVERAESDGASVEIRLESGSGEVRFDASLVRGVVRVSLRTDDDSSGSGSDSGSGGDDSGSGGDDSGSGGNSGPGGGDEDNSGSGSGDD